MPGSSPMHSDTYYMSEALKLADAAKAKGELPFAALLVSPAGDIVLTEHDRVAELRDYTQHAETRLVKTACAKFGPDLTGYALYTTCEPCAMCFTTAWLARISKLVTGTSMAAVYELSGGQQREMPISAGTMNRMGGHAIELVELVLADECLALFEDADFGLHDGQVSG